MYTWLSCKSQFLKFYSQQSWTFFRFPVIILKKSNIITASVSKSAKIVSALKSFTADTTFLNLRKANVIDGIKSVLIIYANYLKKGIHLTKNFSDISEIEYFPEKLLQIWTHLLSNAVQATSGESNISITTMKLFLHRFVILQIKSKLIIVLQLQLP